MSTIPHETCKHCGLKWVPGQVIFAPLECDDRPKVDGVGQPCEPAPKVEENATP